MVRGVVLGHLVPAVFGSLLALLVLLRVVLGRIRRPNLEESIPSGV